MAASKPRGGRPDLTKGDKSTSKGIKPHQKGLRQTSLLIGKAPEIFFSTHEGAFFRRLD
jgi:hypothetical protein